MMNTFRNSVLSKYYQIMAILTDRSAFRDWLASKGWYLPLVKMMIRMHVRNGHMDLAALALDDAISQGMITKAQHEDLRMKYFGGAA
jgi:hypothetical protein